DVENYVFFFQAEDGIRDRNVTGVQTCALPISEGEGQAGRKEEESDEAASPLAPLSTAPRERLLDGSGHLLEALPRYVWAAPRNGARLSWAWDVGRGARPPSWWRGARPRRFRSAIRTPRSQACSRADRKR